YVIDPVPFSYFRVRPRGRGWIFINRRRARCLIYTGFGGSSRRGRWGGRRRLRVHGTGNCSGSSLRLARAQPIRFTPSAVQVLLCCCEIFLTFFELGFRLGKLVGVFLRLLPRLIELLFQTLNHLILCLEFLYVVLRQLQ